MKMFPSHNLTILIMLTTIIHLGMPKHGVIKRECQNYKTILHKIINPCAQKFGTKILR